MRSGGVRRWPTHNPEPLARAARLGDLHGLSAGPARRRTGHQRSGRSHPAPPQTRASDSSFEVRGSAPVRTGRIMRTGRIRSHSLLQERLCVCIEFTPFHEGGRDSFLTKLELAPVSRLSRTPLIGLPRAGGRIMRSAPRGHVHDPGALGRMRANAE